MRHARILIFAAVFGFLSGAIAAFPQDDDQPQERHRADGKNCNNSFETKESDRCACGHALMCDPTNPAKPQMGDRCQWYCHEDHCDCANECNT
jgi:hypothetical protein